MITKMPISSERCHELLDFLDTMRLPEEPVNTEEIISLVEEKDAVEDLSSSSARKYSLDDPANYAPNVPFLLHDENGETIISRTANGINGRELNPYEVNWQEITLYDSDIVKDLLEKVDSMSLMDVAQAIDDEEKRHIRMDGQYTVISSNFYGTGQGSSIFFSYTRDNSSEDLENVPAVTIAEGILDQRKKADAYRKKIKENTDGQTQGKKRHIIEVIDEPESHLHVNLKESNIDQSVEDEINQLKKECDEWKAKHAKLERILQARTDDESKIDSEYMPGGIKPADDRIIDVIKILHAMCKIGLFQKTNGSKITTKAVMEYFGKMLNKDFSKYSSNLSTSKSKTKELSYMQVFNELREAAYDYYKKS